MYAEEINSSISSFCVLNRLSLDHDVVPFHAFGTVREPIFIVSSAIPEDVVNYFLLTNGIFDTPTSQELDIGIKHRKPHAFVVILIAFVF